MRLRGSKRSRIAAVVVATAAIAGCGRSGYQYIESEDAHVFAKIPRDWTVTSEGLVNPTLKPPDSATLSLLPGDDTMPWRAEFTQDSNGEFHPDRPSGYIGAQPVDARLRDSLDVATLLPFDPANADDEYEVVDQREISSGDLTGVRMRITGGSGDQQVVLDRLILTDAGTTAVYIVQVGCRVDCIEAYQDTIDEMMRTFTVERS